MTTRLVSRLTGSLALGLGLASAACIGGTTPPSRHFVLSPLGSQQEMPAADADLSLAVGPVTLPAYLDRPQIVVDRGANERGLEELLRWAEPLDAGLARVLRENISRLLGSQRVSGWPGSQAEAPRFRVAVDVLRFEPSEAEGLVFLEARWTVFTAEGPVAYRRSDIRSPVTVVGSAGWVGALSDAAAELSRQVVTQVQDLAAASG